MPPSVQPRPSIADVLRAEIHQAFKNLLGALMPDGTKVNVDSLVRASLVPSSTYYQTVSLPAAAYGDETWRPGGEIALLTRLEGLINESRKRKLKTT